MDVPRPLPLPGAADVVEPERALAAVLAAVELVAVGAARRVLLTGLPALDRVAADAVVLAQRAHVHLAITRTPGAGVAGAGVACAVVGPVEP